MSWFNRKPNQEKYLQATVRVASNLYAMTIPEGASKLMARVHPPDVASHLDMMTNPGGSDAPITLQFGLPDSRFRYLLFCLSTATTAALAYDEEKNIQADMLVNGCLFFATSVATEFAQEFYDDAAAAQESSANAAAYLQAFLNQWARWPALEKENRSAEIIDLICSMIHTTESNEPASPTDLQRLGPLGLTIDCRLPTMRRAVEALARK